MKQISEIQARKELSRTIYLESVSVNSSNDKGQMVVVALLTFLVIIYIALLTLYINLNRNSYNLIRLEVHLVRNCLDLLLDKYE